MAASSKVFHTSKHDTCKWITKTETPDSSQWIIFGRNWWEMGTRLIRSGIFTDVGGLLLESQRPAADVQVSSWSKMSMHSEYFFSSFIIMGIVTTHDCSQGCIKYCIFWDHKANKNIFCTQTLGILCLNLVTKQNSVYSTHHFIRFETKIGVFYPGNSGF